LDLHPTRSGNGHPVDPGKDEGMKAFLGFLLVYLLINLGLIALGVGIGFLLHRLLPAVDLGTAILIAEVATGFSIHYFVRLLWFSEFLELPRYEFDDSPPVRVYPLASPRSGRKRKRKET
jgi:hypothetical protein